MKPLTERLVQAAAIAILIWVTWSVAANTVLSLVRKNMEINSLQRQVHVLQQRGIPQRGGINK